MVQRGQPFENEGTKQKGWRVTKEARAVGDKESVFCKLAGDFKKEKDFFWSGKRVTEQTREMRKNEFFGVTEG